MYLEIPDKMTINSLDDFYALCPDFDSLNHYQQIQLDAAAKLWTLQESMGATYKQPPGGLYGVLEAVTFKGTTLVTPYSEASTHCSGFQYTVAMESHKEMMGEDYESELDLSVSDMKELRAFSYVFQEDPYTLGGGYGFSKHLERLRKHLADRGIDPNEYLGYKPFYTNDPYEMKFGDYLQFQNKPNIASPGGGHAGIFTGLERRSYEGNEFDAIRLLNSNIKNDYGIKPGIGFCWYTIGKVDPETGYVREARAGGVRSA